MDAAEAEAALDDAGFLEAFEAGEIAPESFHHADHLRLTWTCLRLEGLQAGGDRVAAAIRRFAAIHAPGKYHETITRAWVRLVWTAILREPGRQRFGGFLAAHPELADKGRLEAFYRRETLASEAARGSWCEPDLHPLPSPSREPREARAGGTGGSSGPMAGRRPSAD